MSGIVHNESAHLYVLHVETLKFAQRLDVASCQCHWYVGDAHHASARLPVTPPGQKYLLDFCTFVVAEHQAEVEVKLTVATVEGEHLAVYFGQLAHLAQDQQFVRRDLELKNVQGTVATAVVFCALQPRWTVGHARALPAGDAIIVGHEDSQASYVLEHIFPEKGKEKENGRLEPEDTPLGVATETGEKTADAVLKVSTKEARRSSKVKRRSGRRRSDSVSSVAVEPGKTELLHRMAGPKSPTPEPQRAEAEKPCLDALCSPPLSTRQRSDATSPTRAESCDALEKSMEEPKNLEDAEVEAAISEAPPTSSNCVSEPRAPSEVDSSTTSEKTAPSEGRQDVRVEALEAPRSDSEPELPLPSRQELTEEINEMRGSLVQRGGPMGPMGGLWCRAQRAYAEDCAKQCRRPQDGDEGGPALWLGTRPCSHEKISQVPLKSMGVTGVRPAPLDGWQVHERARWFRVMATALSIRRRPEVDAPLAGELPFGEVFQAVSSTGEDGFKFLELSRGRGWVFSDARVQPVLVIDETAAPVAIEAERRPIQAPVEAEAEPEPNCQSPRISVEAKPLRSWTQPLQPRAVRGRSRGSHERLGPRTSLKETKGTQTTAAPATLPPDADVSAEKVVPRMVEQRPARPAALAPRASTEPVRATHRRRSWSEAPELPAEAASQSHSEDGTRLKTDTSGPLQAFPRQPVRAKHSLASQCFTSSPLTPEPEVGAPTEWSPWRRAWRRARSAEAQTIRHFWDFRSARENLEERQKVQAALLKVALRAHPKDGGLRSTSMPARCRSNSSSLRRLSLFEETMVDGHWNTVAVAKRPSQCRAHDLWEGRALTHGSGVFSRHSTPAVRGQNKPLTPRRPEHILSEDRVTVPRYGISDILLRSAVGP